MKAMRKRKMTPEEIKNYELIYSTKINNNGKLDSTGSQAAYDKQRKL